MGKYKITKSGDARKVTKDLLVKYKPYFQMKAVYFTDNSPYAYVNMMRYEMDSPSVTKGDNILVAADSLIKIYSPEMTGIIDGTKAELSYCGRTVTLNAGSAKAVFNGTAVPLEAASEVINGHFYIDVENVMEKVFGKTAVWQRSYLADGDFLGIGSSREDLFPDKQVGKDLLIYLDKKKGVLRRAYYFEEADQIMPYLLYVPFGYTPEKKYKLVMILHGAGAGVGESRDLNWRPTILETEAEKRNLILLFVEGYGMGFYGGCDPNLQPEKCSQEEKRYLKYCQNEPICALKQVMAEFRVDEKNIFITGNSMGGCGSFWLALQYPNIFKALAPCGALTTDDLSRFDLSPLSGKPLLMVVGSENIGFDNVESQAAYFNSHGIPAKWHGVPGGVHGDAWTYAIDTIFDFFDQS